MPKPTSIRVEEQWRGGSAVADGGKGKRRRCKLEEEDWGGGGGHGGEGAMLGALL